jgi:predicted acetyltransferase
MKIRSVASPERAGTSFPLGAYAFSPSPMAAAEAQRRLTQAPFNAGNVTLVAQDGDRTLATVSAIPMRQNVRGSVYPMAGIAGVATHPLARRQGHIRTLLTRLLGEMRDEGHPVSALYPFRSSFYQRFGYIGLPMPPTVSFAPADLGPLLRTRLPGEIGWSRIGEGYDDHREMTGRMLARRHGFASPPEYRAAGVREADERWLVTARVDGELAGALLYRIDDHGGELLGDHLLTTGPVGRALLLQFIARHVDQVTRVSLTVDPDEAPEQWVTDLAFVMRSRIAFPSEHAPMARVLSLDALTGMAVGPGRVAVRVVDDPFIAGDHLLDGGSGALEVTSGTGAGVPAATLTVPGLSGLVYGVLDPAELEPRGLGTVPGDAAAGLRSLFPRQRPYLVTEF